MKTLFIIMTLLLILSLLFILSCIIVDALTSKEEIKPAPRQKPE